MNASGSLRGPRSNVKPEVSTFWSGIEGKTVWVAEKKKARKHWCPGKNIDSLKEKERKKLCKHASSPFTCVMVSIVALGGRLESTVRLLPWLAAPLCVSSVFRGCQTFPPLQRLVQGTTWPSTGALLSMGWPVAKAFFSIYFNGAPEKKVKSIHCTNTFIIMKCNVLPWRVFHRYWMQYYNGFIFFFTT